jgi:hypothetical protein
MNFKVSFWVLGLADFCWENKSELTSYKNDLEIFNLIPQKYSQCFTYEAYNIFLGDIYLLLVQSEDKDEFVKDFVYDMTNGCCEG